MRSRATKKKTRRKRTTIEQDIIASLKRRLSPDELEDEECCGSNTKSKRETRFGITLLLERRGPGAHYTVGRDTRLSVTIR
jgi:hypothetical protein